MDGVGQMFENEMFLMGHRANTTKHSLTKGHAPIRVQQAGAAIAAPLLNPPFWGGKCDSPSLKPRL
jgi:hypothetical protein